MPTWISIALIPLAAVGVGAIIYLAKRLYHAYKESVSG